MLFFRLDQKELFLPVAVIKAQNNMKKLFIVDMDILKKFVTKLQKAGKLNMFAPLQRRRCHKIITRKVKILQKFVRIDCELFLKFVLECSSG